MARILTATSADGTEVRAGDQGRGPVVLIAHPGLDNGARWRLVASRLVARFRVVRIHRRQYRLDLTGRLPCSMAQEAEDLVALARAIDEPIVLVGHSSGAVAALEAMVAAPSAFSGVVLYEPPIHLRAGEWTAEIERARAALAADKTGKAIAIVTRDIVGLPPLAARVIGLVVAAHPGMRALAPHQIDDAAAIKDLGVRLDAYARIKLPALLIGGGRSPAHLAERLDALAQAMPHPDRVVMHGQGHGANLRAPARSRGSSTPTPARCLQALGVPPSLRPRSNIRSPFRAASDMMRGTSPQRMDRR